MSRFFDGEKVTKFLIGVFVIVYAMLGLRMWNLQVKDGDMYVAHAPTILELR